MGQHLEPASLADEPMIFLPRVVFPVYGLPIAQGSKSVMKSRGTGKLIMIDQKDRTLRPWRQKIRLAAITAMGSPMMLEGPVSVRLDFTMRKPVSAPKRRRTYPDRKPDIDKLARAACDALTDADVYGDDGQIIDMYVTKSYPGETAWALAEPGVTIAVRSLQGWV